MNAHTDIERLLERWFDDGPTRMPERVMTVVADRIDRQRQRRAWRLPWRPRPMNLTLKIVTVLAAVAVIAVIGYTLLPGPTARVGGPAATTSPTPMRTPTASPSSTATRLSGVIATPPDYVWPGALAAGTYTTTFLWQLPFELTFTVPSGWESRDVEIIRDPVISLAVHLVGNTYADPCGNTLSDPPLGPTVDDLAAALASLPGVSVTAPSEVQFDRNTSGKYLELDVPANACGDLPFRLWHDPDGRYRPSLPKGPPEWWAEREHIRLWILDVDGERLVISALSSAQATAADLAELQNVIDSLGIVRPGATQPPTPTTLAP